MRRVVLLVLQSLQRVKVDITASRSRSFRKSVRHSDRLILMLNAHQKNLQYITNKKKNTTNPTGPYCLHIAIKLICLACLRYFALSSLKLLDNVDIPALVSLKWYTI